MSRNNKIHNTAQKQFYCEPAEVLHNSEKCLDIDQHIKSKGTVTVSKDLWTQVHQCLHLMTSVFSQLNNECNKEKDLARHYNVEQYQKEPSLTRESVKQQLFDDDNTTQACVPKGKAVEKIFIRQKRSNRSSIELASRQTFLHNKNNKISEIDGLDSACCNRNNGDIDTSSRNYTSSSPSRPMMEGLTSKKLIVSETSEGSCAESCNLKSSMENSCSKKLSPVSCVADKCHNHTSPHHQPAQELLPSKIFGESAKSTKKKRRPRYRLVRRRSSSCRTQGRSREATTSEHESDPGKRENFEKNEHVFGMSEKRHVARNKHSFDQCLSDNDDFHIPEKAKKTTVKDNKLTESHSSPEIDDVILVEAPSTAFVNNKPVRLRAHRIGRIPVESPPLPSAIDRNKRLLMIGSSDRHCHSSTPRKHTKEKNIAPSPNPASRNGSLEIMPSPIKSTLNTTVSETLANNTSTSNESHFNVASPECQRYNSFLSSPVARKSQSECSILQPEISVSFLAKKEISKDNNKRNEIPSGENNDAYTKKLFRSSLQERFPASSSPSDDLLPNKGQSKKNQHEILMPRSGGLSRSTLNENLEVVSRTKPFFQEDDNKSKSGRELFATERELCSSKNSSMFESSHHFSKKQSKITSSSKLNRPKHSSEKFIAPFNQQSKITPTRAKHHPYATSNKFPRTPKSHSPFQSSSVRTPSLISPFQGLTIKSPSSARHKWTTLDRSPMAICFKQARQISDPVVASRTILQFGSRDSDNEKKSREEARSSNQMKNKTRSNKSTIQARNMTDHRFADDSRSNCSNGKCLKAFCFNCSMELA